MRDPRLKRAISRPCQRSERPSLRGRFSMAVMATHGELDMHFLLCFDLDQPVALDLNGGELEWARIVAFEPGVGSAVFRTLETIEQTLLHSVRSVDGLAADFLHPETFDEIVGSFQIDAVLTVVLKE